MDLLRLKAFIEANVPYTDYKDQFLAVAEEHAAELAEILTSDPLAEAAANAATPLFDIVRNEVIPHWEKYTAAFKADHNNQVDNYVRWCLCVLKAENEGEMNRRECAEMIQKGRKPINTAVDAEELIKDICCGDFDPWTLVNEYASTGMSAVEFARRLDAEDDWVSFRGRVIEFCSDE